MVSTGAAISAAWRSGDFRRRRNGGEECSPLKEVELYLQKISIKCQGCEGEVTPWQTDFISATLSMRSIAPP